MKPIFLFLILAFSSTTEIFGIHPGQVRDTAHLETVKADEVYQITFLGGDAVLEISEGNDFPCIGIRFSDKTINMGMGTYIEIKKQDGFYVAKVPYELEKFETLEQGLKVCIKDIFIRFYERNKDLESGEEVWSEFVESGGLQLFLDQSIIWIDDEFLLTPFNEIYG